MPEITRLEGPDAEQEMLESIRAGKPAVIKDAIDWEILKYDPSSLIEDDRIVQVTEDPVGLFGPGHYGRVGLPFGEVRRRWLSAAPKNFYYMDQRSIERFHPEMSNLIGYPSYINRDKLVATNLWMGEGRLRWHFDGVDNFLAQVYGRKRIRLLPPQELPNLYVFGMQWSAIDDIDDVDINIFPRAKELAPAQDAMLEKGDILFIPAAWWHTTASVGGWNASLNYWYQTWYGLDKSAFERPFFSAIEHLTHLLAEEVSDAERQHYCRYASEMIRRIGAGLALPARAAGGWDNPKRVDFTPVRDRVPPKFPDKI